MNCPACGEPNDDATKCVKCGAPFRPAATDAAAARPRTSRKAVASFVFGIVGIIGAGFLWALFFLGALLPFLWGLLDIVGGPLGMLPLALLCVVLCIVAIALGGGSCNDIRASSGELTGLGFARAGIILGTCSLVLGLALPFVLSALGREVVPPRTANSHMRTEMRSLQIAIEAYYVDTGTYPAWAVGAAGPGGSWSYNYGVASRQDALEPRRSWYYESKKCGPFSAFKRISHESNSPADLPCFALTVNKPYQRFQTLTTPLTYITSYPEDWLSPIRGATFVYWSVWPGAADPSGKIVGKDSPTSGVGYILVSPGPDRKYDIPGDWDVYDPSVPQPSKRLLVGTNKKGYAFTYDPTNGAISHGDIWRVKQ